MDTANSYIRKAFVAGQFYEANPLLLKRQVEGYINRDAVKQEVLGLMAPHAGFIYSGAVAGAVYSSVFLPESLIILGPNHTGIGTPVSVYPKGVWETPIHNFNIDVDLADAIINRCKYCKVDVTAHSFEHSIEVHLPFIACLKEGIKIVPIAVMKATVEECSAIGQSIAEVIKASTKKILIAASTDMSHYVSDERARSLDSIAIERIMAIDPEGLFEVVTRNKISMCGLLPVTIMLFAVKSLGATKTSFIKYSTSAETSGDFKHVVGYAGLIIY